MRSNTDRKPSRLAPVLAALGTILVVFILVGTMLWAFLLSLIHIWAQLGSYVWTR